MVELSNSTVMHTIVVGISLVLANFLLHALVTAGLVPMNQALIDLGWWLFGIGLGLAGLFGVLFIVFNDIV